MPRILIDLTGKTFGQLIVEGESPGAARGRRWICRCSCGDRRQYIMGNLTHHRSVRCLNCSRASTAAKLRNHEKGDKLYQKWKSMRQRCNNPNDARFYRYGGRGISVAPEWNDYTVYREYVQTVLGPKPGPRYSIDRIDNNGNYEPGNIRWADDFVQANNRRQGWFKRERNAAGQFA